MSTLGDCAVEVPTVGVLAVQGDVREHLRALTDADSVARPIRRPSELEGVNALVIPGGESTTMSKLAIEFGLLDPIRAMIADGLPAYGSCAGMIMLATDVLDGRPDQRGFGGIDMTVRRNAFGRQVDSFETTVTLDGIAGGPFHAVFIRAPWVERVGEGVEVLGRIEGEGDGRTGDARGAGRTDVGPRAGRIVAVRQRNLLATAFHPEIAGDGRVHRFFVDMVRSAGRTREAAKAEV